MTQDELKDALLEMTETYFVGATVTWGMTKLVKPLPSHVALSMGSIARPLQPIMINVNGVPWGYYPSKTVFEVNLYTKGRVIGHEGNVTASQVNTAVNDLVDFVNYVNSPAITDWSFLKDISISVKTDVQDVSELINDTHWDYRAMVEFDIDFTQIAVGAYGLSRPWAQTASGGGSDELAGSQTGYFEEVEIEVETKEDLKNG